MKLLLHTKKLMLPAILLIAGFCVSQNQSLDTLRSHMSKLNISETSSYLEKIDTTTLKDYDKALWYFYSGLNYRNKDQHGLGFKDLREAERKFTSIDSLKDASDTNYEIVVLLSHQADNKVNPKPFLDKYIAFAELQANSLILARAYSRIASNYMHVDSFQKSQEYYLKTFNEIEKIKKKDIKEISNAKIKLNYGSLYRTVPKEIGRKKEYDSALYFYSKALPILLKYNLNNDVATTYNNIAYSYFGKKKFQKAIDFYKKADSVPLTENIPKTKVIFYKNMAEAFDSLKDYKSALTYYSKQIKLTDSINDIAQNLNMAELNKKYLNTELKAENLEEKAKNSKKTTQLTIALSILFLVIISAYLIQKNTRKKQLLAEQAKNLEAQKVSTLLKEQELASIDAMIEGQ